MLCPEVWNFPPPKVVSSCRKLGKFGNLDKSVPSNNFYKSVVITCPDELQMPKDITDAIIEDSEYYLINCSLTEFLDPVFIKSFVKNGKLFCLSAYRNCISQNCASITPDGILTLHILEFIFQTLGIEGEKCPHGFSQIKINLNHVKPTDNKLQCALKKLELFEFYIRWEPGTEEICPSSIAKYFCDKNIPVSSQSLEIKMYRPNINKVPSLADVEIEEIVEWIGMLVTNGDLTPKEPYISTYREPECTSSIQTNRISLLVTKGFLTPTSLARLSQVLSNYVDLREINNYWASMSIQTMEDSQWRWNFSMPNKFQSHYSSCSIFLTKEDIVVYSIGQLKYS